MALFNFLYAFVIALDITSTIDDELDIEDWDYLDSDVLY
jgi:hypothetical protein